MEIVDKSTSAKTDDGLTVIFMTKPDHHLEWQAIILAASWRRYFGDRVNLHAFVEEADLPGMSDLTLSRLQQLDVKVRTITSQAQFNSPYPIGNKILASANDFPTERVCFVDSDTFVNREFDLAPLFGGIVAAAPAGTTTWQPTNEYSWEYLYERYVGLTELPDDITLESGIQYRPYFNAGVVAFSQSTGFARRWLRVAQSIDFDASVTDKRPWLDQVALPIAAACTGKTYPDHELFNVLNAHMNYNPDVGGNFNEINIFHYHGVARIYRNSLNEKISKILNDMNISKNMFNITDPVIQKINAK